MNNLHPCFLLFFLCCLCPSLLPPSSLFAPAGSPSSLLLSIYACQAVTTSIPPFHWFSPLPLFISSSSIPSRSHIHSYFSLYASLSGGFPSCHLSVSFVGSVYTITTSALLFLPFISLLLFQFQFFTSASLPTRKSTEPHPTSCLLRGLRRH